MNIKGSFSEYSPVPPARELNNPSCSLGTGGKVNSENEEKIRPTALRKEMLVSSTSSKPPEGKESADWSNSLSYKKTSLIEKSTLGWELLGEKVHNSRLFQWQDKMKGKITGALSAPFKKLYKYLHVEASRIAEDSLEMKEIHSQGNQNFEKMKDQLPLYPGEKHINKINNSETDPSPEVAPAQDDFWERHPVLHSLYLGCKAIRKLPRDLLEMGLLVPRMLYKVVIPAMYSSLSKAEVVGAKPLASLLGKIKDNALIKSCYENTMKLARLPGVSLAINILAPVLGISRMSDGLKQYRQGVENNNPHQRLEGKVDMMTGALTTVKPLALLGILTEGVHIYLNHRIKKHGMDPAKAEQIMTSVFSAVTAPIGLAAYALLA